MGEEDADSLEKWLRSEQDAEPVSSKIVLLQTVRFENVKINSRNSDKR